MCFKLTMQVSDDCAICRRTMLRKPVVRLLPCRHFLHETCALPLAQRDAFNCPICRQNVVDKEQHQRTTYRRTVQSDRERIVECSNRGEDWKTLATTLGVKYKTAYTWIRSGSTEAAKRGGGKPRALTQHLVNEILIWLEEDCSITLKKIQEKFLVEHRVIVSTTTIANYLEGQIYTLKQVQWQPCAMNSEANKELRRQFVISLNNYNYTRRKTDHVDRRDQL